MLTFEDEVFQPGNIPAGATTPAKMAKAVVEQQIPD